MKTHVNAQLIFRRQDGFAPEFAKLDVPLLELPVDCNHRGLTLRLLHHHFQSYLAMRCCILHHRPQGPDDTVHLCIRHRWRAPKSCKVRVLVSPQCGIDCAFVAIDSRCDGADRKHQDLSQSMYDGQLSFAHGFARKPRIELMLRQCLAHLVTLKKKKSGC